MLNVRTESMIDRYTAGKNVLSDIKTFQTPQEKHALLGLFIDPICMLCEGQVVVDLRAQVFKDLNLFHHLPLQTGWYRERVWGVGCPAPSATQLCVLTDVHFQGALLEPEDHVVHILPVCAQSLEAVQKCAYVYCIKSRRKVLV